MSGLEVVGLVAAIVSAFTGGTDLFIKWRDRKRQRRREAENNNAELILRRGAPAVQNEYDADFRRLGRAFARGDGETVYGQLVVYAELTFNRRNWSHGSYGAAHHDATCRYHSAQPSAVE